MSDKTVEALANLEASLTRQAECIVRRDAAGLQAALAEGAGYLERLTGAFSHNPTAVTPFEERIRAATAAADGLEKQAAALLRDMQASIAETTRLRNGYRAMGAALRTRSEGGGILNQKR